VTHTGGETRRLRLPLLPQPGHDDPGELAEGVGVERGTAGAQNDEEGLVGHRQTVTPAG